MKDKITENIYKLVVLMDMNDRHHQLQSCEINQFVSDEFGFLTLDDNMTYAKTSQYYPTMNNNPTVDFINSKERYNFPKLHYPVMKVFHEMYVSSNKEDIKDMYYSIISHLYEFIICIENDTTRDLFDEIHEKINLEMDFFKRCNCYLLHDKDKHKNKYINFIFYDINTKKYTKYTPLELNNMYSLNDLMMKYAVDFLPTCPKKRLLILHHFHTVYLFYDQFMKRMNTGIRSYNIELK